MAVTNLLGGLNNETTQASVLSALQSLLSKTNGDQATQTTLAAVLAKLVTSPALDATVASIVTSLNTGTAHTDSAAILAKLASSPALDATVAAITTALNSGVPHTDSAALLAQLGKGTNTALKGRSDASAVGDAGSAIFAVRGLTTPTALTDAAGDYTPFLADAEGKMVHIVGAIPENTFQGSVQTTTAATTALVAAKGAGIRNYVTDLEIIIASAVAQNITVLDGSTVVARYSLPATIGASMVLSRRTPLRGTAATAVNVTTSAAGTVNFNYSGYSGV